MSNKKKSEHKVAKKKSETVHNQFQFKTCKRFCVHGTLHTLQLIIEDIRVNKNLIRGI